MPDDLKAKDLLANPEISADSHEDAHDDDCEMSIESSNQCQNGVCNVAWKPQRVFVAA